MTNLLGPQPQLSQLPSYGSFSRYVLLNSRQGMVLAPPCFWTLLTDNVPGTFLELFRRPLTLIAQPTPVVSMCKQPQCRKQPDAIDITCVLPDAPRCLVATQVVGAKANVLDHKLLGVEGLGFRVSGIGIAIYIYIYIFLGRFPLRIIIGGAIISLVYGGTSPAT